jgi:nicotinamide mononucleotide transporter
MSPIEVVGTVLSLAGIGLTVRGSVWNWPWSIAASLVYAWIFWTQHYYSSVALNLLCFVPMSAYGWWHWTHAKGNDADTAPITRLRVAGLIGSIALATAFTGGWGFMMSRTDAVLPFLDAFVTGISVSAQWLQARKVYENWYLWIVADAIAAAFLYPAQKLWLTSGLYGVFLLLAIAGAIQWRRLAAAVPDSASEGLNRRA